ncbi:MAG: zinc-binding metallopeptidase family protein [Terriglobales bacterium]
MHAIRLAGLTLALIGTLLAQSAPQPAAARALPQRTSAWLSLTAADREAVGALGEDTKRFLNIARQNQLAVTEVLRRAQAQHFRELTPGMHLTPGTRFYVNNRGRAVVLGIVGSRGGTHGFRIIGTHVDSPWLELKANPLVEKQGFVLFHVLTHGGLKHYQWVNRPLALTGHIDRRDGNRVEVSIGLTPGDPVFVIPDLAPHVDSPLRTRTYTNVISTEEMLPVVASEPLGEAGVMGQALEQLFKLYGISPEDFTSAELILTPNEPPADAGLDRALIAAYGQDDRLNSFLATRAILDYPGTPERTAFAYLTNNEEVGSVNNTGASSQFLDSVLTRLLAGELGSGMSELALRAAKDATEVISVDCNTGINPNFPQVQEADNAARLGYGVTLKRYGHGFDANSEFTARFRRMFAAQHIPWQTSTYVEGIGGGGTIGLFFSEQNMEVIDLGVPLLSMHSPYELSSKVDAWEMVRAMQGFIAMP